MVGLGAGLMAVQHNFATLKVSRFEGAAAEAHDTAQANTIQQKELMADGSRDCRPCIRRRHV